jgi:hypothetical protein
MTAAEARITWVSLREAASLVARRLGYTEEYAALWILREAAAGRLKARGRTLEWRLTSLLPTAWQWSIDWNAGALWSLQFRITHVALYLGHLDDLTAAGLLPAPKDNAMEQERWPALWALAYAIRGVPHEWIPEMNPWIETAAKELGRMIGDDRVEAWGRNSRLRGMKRIPGSDCHIQGFVWVVCPDGNMRPEPLPNLAAYIKKCLDEGTKPRLWYAIEFAPDGIKRTFPELPPIRTAKWVHERHLAVTGMLTKLSAEVKLETNRSDWARFIELIALIDGNPESSSSEVSALVRLSGFNHAAVWVAAWADNALCAALYEAEEIRRRIRDRLVDAICDPRQPSAELAEFEAASSSPPVDATTAEAATPPPKPGRPTDHDLIVGEAVRRLKETVPRRQAPFRREIRNSLKKHPEAHRDSKNEVASDDTIKEHIRDPIRVAAEAERQLKAGKATPSDLAAFVGGLRAWLEKQPNAYRSNKTGEVMSADIIEELVRDRFTKFWNR